MFSWPLEFCPKLVACERAELTLCNFFQCFSLVEAPVSTPVLFLSPSPPSCGDLGGEARCLHHVQDVGYHSGDSPPNMTIVLHPSCFPVLDQQTSLTRVSGGESPPPQAALEAQSISSLFPHLWHFPTSFELFFRDQPNRSFFISYNFLKF